MENINDIVEQNDIERFYLFRGPDGATAIELVVGGSDLPRLVIDEGDKARSIEAAKQVLRGYRMLIGLPVPSFWPCGPWATLTPVNAKTREAELCAIAQAQLEEIRFALRWQPHRKPVPLLS